MKLIAIPIALVVLVILAGVAHTPQTTAAGTVRVYIQLASSPRSQDTAAVRGLGGQPRHSFPSANTISADVPASALPRLLANPRFVGYRLVPKVEATDDQLDWGVDRVNAEVVWGGAEDATNVASGHPSGAGVKVAIIDTGSGPHPDLSIAGGVNCVTPSVENDGCVSGGYTDDNGHGTHVAGTLAALDNGSGLVGVAPNASIYAVKALDASGSGYMDDIAAGITWADQNGMQIISMSLGCYSASNPSACDDPVMSSAIQAAYNDGVLIFAAAGNSGNAQGSGNNVGYPAAYPDVIAVAASCGPAGSRDSYCTTTDGRASFSSTGSKVELTAPGDYITSTYLNNSYATLDGTSMATPHAAGVAALLLSCNPSLSNTQARSILDNTALDLGSSGRDSLFGYGLVQADQAVAATNCGGGGTSSDPTPTPSPTPTQIGPTPTRTATPTQTATSVPSPGYSSDFESGSAGWTTSGLWHLASNTSCVSPSANSPTHAFYYGQESPKCNYATGAATSGSLTSPNISGLSGQTTLSFAYYRQVEFYSNCLTTCYDQTTVQVSYNGGSTWSTVWSEDSKVASENAWKTVSVALAPTNGTAIVRFVFNSVDGANNTYKGWLIDDVQVTTQPSGPSPTATSTSSPTPTRTATPVRTPTRTPTSVPPTATPSGPAPAQLISPTPGYALTAKNTTFSWTKGSGAVQYRLEVGASINGGNYCNITTTALSQACGGLSLNEMVYVRLWTQYSNGTWVYTDYSYN